MGIVPISEARESATEAGLDLVEISPNAEPPVCRVMDYGKYIYDLRKKHKKKTTQVQLKEIKFRPTTDIGDFQTKVRKIRDFLSSGHKVKVTIRFRGREMMHPELGLELLRRVEADLKEDAQIESSAKREGRQIAMILVPLRR